jgi:hypothetical protein
MGLFAELLKTVVYAAGTFVGVTAATARHFAQTVRAAYRKHVAARPVGTVEVEREKTFRQISTVNDEIAELRRKKRRDGWLSESDFERLVSLEKNRKVFGNRAEENREILIGREIESGVYSYDALSVSDEKAHVLQFHVGQSVAGKRCVCGKPMVLRWRRDVIAPGLSDFFWGCTGYYEGCRETKPFQTRDIDLFARTDRPEFQVSSKQLSRVLTLPGVEPQVRKRLRELKGEQNDRYVCPLHYEPLEFRPSQGAHDKGILEAFYLRCPRAQSADEPCKYFQTITSPAQIASVLEAYQGRGLL